MSKKARQNIVGPKIRQLRYQLGLTQNELAARIGLQGWDISRGTLSQIEAQIRCVTDYELLCLCRALRVTLLDLLPTGAAVKKTLNEFFPERSAE